jgi:hypothetical protein
VVLVVEAHGEHLGLDGGLIPDRGWEVHSP